MMFFGRGDGDPALSLNPGVSHLPGFPSRERMLERYGASSSSDLSSMAFYKAFFSYKFAVFTPGVQARGAAGEMGGQDFGHFDDEIRQLGQRGLELV